ncbi:MAG: micrococcal nuclease [Gammaproteobacteria bacterium]|jgi:micrococcal nuclease
MAFFCFWIWFFILQTTIQHAYAVNHCTNQAFDQVIRIKHVIDGDTVISNNDEHIRLIGIDTPEINYKTGVSETGAITAKNYLKDLIQDAHSIGIIFDDEKHDKYGRTLAHLFLDDGTNIQTMMLLRGMAVPFTYPPNLKYTSCYYQAAETAHKDKQGLWAMTKYHPIASDNLSKDDLGYKVIYGKIGDITDSKHSQILQFSQKFSALINKSRLKYFESMDINTVLGNQIQVQGELYQQDGKFWILLRHPLDLKILSSEYNSSNQNR